MRYAAGENFLVRALVALAARRVRRVREAARAHANALAAAGKAVLFEYRARRRAHGAAAEGVRAEVAVRARRGARRAENRLEAAPGITERGGPLLQLLRPRRHLPEPGERRRRREQIAGDDGCYDFEQVGRHGATARPSRVGIIVNEVSALLNLPRGLRRSALSEDSNLARQSAAARGRGTARAKRVLKRPITRCRTLLEAWGAFQRFYGGVRV